MRKIDIDHRTEIDKRYEVYTHTQITIDFIAYNMRHPLGRDFFFLLTHESAEFKYTEICGEKSGKNSRKNSHLAFICCCHNP